MRRFDPDAQDAPQAASWDETDEDAWYPRMPKSALRYPRTPDERLPARPRTPTYAVSRGRPPSPYPQRASLQRPPPDEQRKGRRSDALPRRRMHPLVFIGIALFIALLGWVVLTTVAIWVTNTQEQWQYGYPRTAQYDVVVGHHDSATHPSHFIALNLNGQVEVIEFPGGDASKARIYTGLTVVVGQNANLVPVTLSFQDVNGDGLPDMIVTVGNAHYVFLNQKGQFVKSQN